MLQQLPAYRFSRVFVGLNGRQFLDRSQFNSYAESYRQIRFMDLRLAPPSTKTTRSNQIQTKCKNWATQHLLYSYTARKCTVRVLFLVGVNILWKVLVAILLLCHGGCVFFSLCSHFVWTRKKHTPLTHKHLVAKFSNVYSISVGLILAWRR